MQRIVALPLVAALVACSPSSPSKPSPPAATGVTGVAPASQPAVAAAGPGSQPSPAPGVPAPGSQPSATPGARAPGADAVLEDLKALNSSIKSEVMGAGLALRMPRRQGAADEWREALSRAAQAARRISQGFDRYSARTSEVRSLSKEAARAWAALGDAYARMNTELAKATGDAAVDEMAALKDAKDAADTARKQVDEVMRRLGKLAERRGL
ncbi:MAG: hypothetical protein HY906_02575 [Deltaproteobacteria bacterium]|nr:hypothetical protein [Deltaproteobacteria bacterium]